MNITVSHRDLRDAVRRVASIAPGKTDLPVLCNILFDADETSVRLTATDLVIATTATIPATVTEPGRALIAADALSDLVPHLPAGEVTIGPDGTGTPGSHAALICSGIGNQRIRTRLNGHDAADYPFLPAIKDAHQTVTINAAQLRDTLEVALCSIAPNNDGRPALNGVSIRLEGTELTLASCDGFRVTRVTLPCRTEAPGFDVIVPGAGIKALVKLLTDDAADVELHVTADEGLLVAETGDVRFCARLVDGRFPDVMQIIPNDRPTTITLDRRLIRAALAANLPFARDNNHVIRLQTTAGDDAPTDTEGAPIEGLIVSSAAYDRGSASFQVGATVTGSPVAFGLDGRFFRDALAVGGDGQITIGVLDGEQVVTVINDSVPTAIHAIMPMVAPKGIDG